MPTLTATLLLVDTVSQIANSTLAETLYFSIGFWTSVVMFLAIGMFMSVIIMLFPGIPFAQIVYALSDKARMVKPFHDKHNSTTSEEKKKNNDQ